jgi:hypothetical protein
MIGTDGSAGGEEKISHINFSLKCFIRNQGTILINKLKISDGMIQGIGYFLSIYFLRDSHHAAQK